jgi:hypothetical protein
MDIILIQRHLPIGVKWKLDSGNNISQILPFTEREFQSQSPLRHHQCADAFLKANGIYQPKTPAESAWSLTTYDTTKH